MTVSYGNQWSLGRRRPISPSLVYQRQTVLVCRGTTQQDIPSHNEICWNLQVHPLEDSDSWEWSSGYRQVPEGLDGGIYGYLRLKLLEHFVEGRVEGREEQEPREVRETVCACCRLGKGIQVV